MERKERVNMSEYNCQFCGFQYDERYGDSRNGIPKGTPFFQLAGSLCSRCGMQGERHKRRAATLYRGLEAENYDLFAGKSGIAFYKNWLRSFPSPSVLELGIGTGRIGLELAKLGISVTGVDNSEEMLAMASKKKERLNECSVEFIYGDAHTLSLEDKFTHILLTDGFLQHFTDANEQVELLQIVKQQLVPGGFVAVDMVLPPNGQAWSYKQCKEWGKKKIYQTVEGETNLSKQLFYTTVTYETFKDGIEQSRYRVEREYSLVLPREVGYLLEFAGFEVIKMVENYSELDSSHPFDDRKKEERRLAIDETLDGEFSLEERNIKAYKEDVWQNGGYPFPIKVEPRNTGGTRWTLIATMR